MLAAVVKRAYMAHGSGMQALLSSQLYALCNPDGLIKQLPIACTWLASLLNTASAWLSVAGRGSAIQAAWHITERSLSRKHERSFMYRTSMAPVSSTKMYMCMQFPVLCTQMFATGTSTLINNGSLPSRQPADRCKATLRTQHVQAHHKQATVRHLGYR
jgi:hypothetical protein